MSARHPHQRHAAGNPRRDARAGRRAGAAHRARAARAASSATSTSAGRARAARHADRRSSRSASSAPRSCTSPTSGSSRAERPRRRDRRRSSGSCFEGQTLLVQVIKDPIGTKGARLSTQISHRRPAAGLPAAGLAHRHLAADRGREPSARCLREQAAGAAAGEGDDTAASSSAPWPKTATDARARRRHRLPAQDCGATSRERAAHVPAPTLLLPGPEPGAARAARHGDRRDAARSCVDSRETFEKLQEFAPRVHAERSSSASQHYAGERPLFDLYGVEDEIEKALARRVDLKSGGYLIIDQTEAMTTIDVNTGGFVGGAQLRRHDLQDQPRGGAGDRAPAAPAQPRRHHHHRLHRHGERRAPRRGAGRAQQGARARPHARSR